MRGYLHEAQRNLALKQLDPRLWSYWRLENAWGNLRLDADPIARENIMLAGFLTAQLAYARAACGLTDFDGDDSLAFERARERFSYSLPVIACNLAVQYEDARYGLLACEPNWIYPLCNLITASGLQTADAQYGTDHWATVAPGFWRSLDNEFTNSSGKFAAFRSSLTGLAPPSLGGAVMDAFPCLFLNTLCSERAQRHWASARRKLIGNDIKRALWPIDVGNYGFSRASSYAGCAAAAAEMGDADVAATMLAMLDEACPTQLDSGVAHRGRASLWAHAVELMARFGGYNQLRNLSNHAAASSAQSGPIILEAAYPKVLAARATNCDGILHAVLHAGDGDGFQTLTIGALCPDQSYDITSSNGSAGQFSANAQGTADVHIPIFGRTELLIRRAA